MKKVKIDTKEKKNKIDSIAEKMSIAIDKQDTLQKKLKEGTLTDDEIDDYVEIDKEVDTIHQELKDFIEEFGK